MKNKSLSIMQCIGLAIFIAFVLITITLGLVNVNIFPSELCGGLIAAEVGAVATVLATYIGLFKPFYEHKEIEKNEIKERDEKSVKYITNRYISSYLKGVNNVVNHPEPRFIESIANMFLENHCHDSEKVEEYEASFLNILGEEKIRTITSRMHRIDDVIKKLTTLDYDRYQRDWNEHIEEGDSLDSVVLRLFNYNISTNGKIDDYGNLCGRCIEGNTLDECILDILNTIKEWSNEIEDAINDR